MKALLLTLIFAQRIEPPLGLDAYLPVPESNPLTPAKITLGRKLFFDTRLSRTGAVSCATCHDPKRAFTDEGPVAVGVDGKKGPRRTPRIFNRVYGKSFFWDGRAATLEEQVLMPIANPLEMDMEPAAAAVRVGLSVPAMRDALASYVRTILAGGAPIDRYLAGDSGALSAQQREGLKLFRGKAGCAVCHPGPNFTDERFHNTGIGGDSGRFAITKSEQDRGAFKTPGLRQVAEGAPYMHDGSLRTLDDVVEHYNNGGKANPNLDPELRELRLTQAEKASLVEFLRALGGVVREGL